MMKSPIRNISDKNPVSGQIVAETLGASSNILDQAMAWLARDGVGVSGTANDEAFRLWCATSPAHEQAARQVSDFMRDRSFDDLMVRMAEKNRFDEAGAGRVLLFAKRRWSPVRMTGILAAACVLIAVLASDRDIFRSGSGTMIEADSKPKSQILADGSTVQLARGSVLTWDFSGDARQIDLIGGAVVIDAAHDAARPMVITTPHATTTVVGTRFAVIYDETASTIDVEEGIVRVTPSGPGEVPETTLLAGEGVSVSDIGDVSRRQISTASVGQVLDGWRVFAPNRLGDVVGSINRQSGAKILMDIGVGDIMIRGRYHVTDAVQSVQLITASTGLSAHSLPFGYMFLTDRF
ncbi:FecR domain-containing protein [Thalassospira sp.]|uniref:FecR family protein n=1 Tax=Thalassospira sp. TaxID=1912094 RepID=UPI002734A37E|nr:FecR domain-containing protein [Thalassospira sp.]MDP2698378.1 FecR domain-containing protein [Thalassospira sp.]